MAKFDVNESVAAWKRFLESSGGWEKLVEGRSPMQTGCGPVYEIGNPLERPNEDFAIADMRKFKIAEPHYHPAPDIEIYVALEGEGIIVHGGDEIPIKPGGVVVINPDTTHYAVPTSGLVLALINTPPFQADRYIPITDSSTKYKFNKTQFDRLKAQSKSN